MKEQQYPIKKTGIIILIPIIVIFALAYLFFQETEKDKKENCNNDDECKLIYNNCECKAVLKTDPRSSLENNNEICKWNICQGANVTAICINNKCMRSDK